MAIGKESRYAVCLDQILALCDGESDGIALMASVVAVLHQKMEDFFWTGFYRVVDGELVIGPYQGTVGCLRIAFGRGVCGTAVETGETQVVADVHDFPGHIACDFRSNSEIVVPVRNASGRLLGVLDVDSEIKGCFDETDKKHLETILAVVFAKAENS